MAVFYCGLEEIAVFVVGCGSGSGSGRVDMGCWEGWKSSED